MSELTAVGSYIFCGGFTIGVERHFKVLAHLENGPYGVKTFQLNRPKIPVYLDPKTWPTKNLRGKVDFVYANPPCALFSAAGASVQKGKDNWRTDPRRSCWDDCFGLLEKVEPSALAIESVPLAFKRGREMMDAFAERAHKLGYGITHLLEDARWFGLPQTRKRYMFIAHRYGLPMERINWRPAPTVGEVLGQVTTVGYYTPVRQDHLKLIRKLRPGEPLRAAWERANPPATWARGPRGVKGRPRFCHHRIPADGVMGAYIGDFFIHPTEPRNLSIEEVKAVCGFPEDWKFSHESGAFSEIARGVLPPVADWVARSVAASLQGRKRAAALEAVVVDMRKPEEEQA